MNLPPILKIGASVLEQIVAALKAVPEWSTDQVESAAPGVLAFKGEHLGWSFLVVRWEPRHASMFGKTADQFCVDGTARKDSTIVRLSTPELRSAAMAATEHLWRIAKQA